MKRSLLKKWSSFHALVALFTIMSVTVAAQITYDETVEVHVRSNSGGVVKHTGIIQGSSNFENLILLTEDGVQLTIPMDKINLILSNGYSTIPKEVRDYESNETTTDRHTTKQDIKRTGMYAALGVGLSYGRVNGFGDVYPSIDLTAGYRFRPEFGLGLNFGYHEYDWWITPSGLGSLSAEARGYFNDQKVSPYYRANLGYGFGIFNDETIFNDFEEIRGGVYYQAGLGLRILGHSSIQMNFELGLKGQNATYEQSNRGIIERDAQYRRPYFSLGIMF